LGIRVAHVFYSKEIDWAIPSGIFQQIYSGVRECSRKKMHASVEIVDFAKSWIVFRAFSIYHLPVIPQLVNLTVIL
jgi:hypothetical protein